MFFIDIQKIIDDVKEHKAKKKHLHEVGEQFDKDATSYKEFANENASCIGSIEEVVKEINEPDVKGTETTTYAFSENGPVIKKHIQKEEKDGGVTYVYDYTTYEGYIKPTGDKQAVSGYVQIMTYHKTLLPKQRLGEEKPQVQEYNFYEGVYKNSNGKVVEFDERQEGIEHSGKYGDVVNAFEQSIKKTKEKQQQIQNDIQI